MFGRKKESEFKKIQNVSMEVPVAQSVEEVQKVQPKQIQQTQNPEEPTEDEVLDILEGSVVRMIIQGNRALEIIKYIRSKSEQ